MTRIASAVCRAAPLIFGVLSAISPLLGAGHPSATPDVRIDDRRLSVRADSLPLRDLIAAAERAGLARIELHGDVSKITVSDSFDDLDVAQALRRVLSAYSHVLIDRTSGEGRLIELILLTQGSGPQQVADPKRRQPGGDEAPDRVATELPVEGHQDTGLNDEELVERLQDPDENVRARALEELKDTGDAIPVEEVEQVAHGDVSPERRIQSLELLAERAEQRARRPLRRALRDSEPAVRARAQELIEDWHLQE